MNEWRLESNYLQLVLKSSVFLQRIIFFLQVQELVEGAILEEQGAGGGGGVYTQQQPYPCFTRDNFNSGLYTAQILQVTHISFKSSTFTWLPKP